MKLLEKNQPTVLKRTREVKKRLIVQGRIQDLGSLIVVVYKAPNDKKEKIRNLVKKAPCIRICRRVYAFYQRDTHFDPEKKLINAQHLATSIKDLGGKVKLIPKLIIHDEYSTQRLIDEIEQKLENEILDMIENCNRVYGKKQLKNESDRKYLDNSLRKFRRQYIVAKRKANYYEKWMALDFSKSLRKAYRALSKLQHHS